MTVCKIICVSVLNSSNCLAHADVIWVYSHYTAVVSEFLDFPRDLALCLGHSFLWTLQIVRGKKGLEKYLLQLIRQWFYVTDHYEIGSKCYVMA